MKAPPSSDSFTEVVGNEMLTNFDVQGSVDGLEPPPEVEQPMMLDLPEPVQPEDPGVRPEELEAAKTILLEAGTTHHKEASKSGGHTPTVAVSKPAAKPTIAPTPMEGAPLELAVEDGLLPNNKKHIQKTSLLAVGSDDMGGAVGYLRSRLAAEEQFTVRLQQLLAQSGKEGASKQHQMDLLEQQLRSSSKAKQETQQSSAKALMEEKTELARQRSRADLAEKQLRQTTGEVGTLQRTMQWMRTRVSTLLAHLANVTHIGKAMEAELAAAKHTTAVAGQKLRAAQRQAAVEHRIPMKIEAKLKKVVTEEASAVKRLTTKQRQNDKLQERILAVSKRDKILQTENSLLRAKLASKNGDEEHLHQELERIKGMLADTQKNNMQLQSQYADSLQGLVAPSATSPSKEETIVNTSSARSLKSDVGGLSTLIEQSNAPAASRQAIHDRDKKELSRDSQGLNNLLEFGVVQQLRH